MAKSENFDILRGRAEAVFPTGKQSVYNLFGKRLLDLGILFLAAPVSIPLMGAIALAICATRGGPVYGHRRVGQDGKSFKCWKFRTMVPNADEVITHLLETDPEAAREWALRRKLTNDPRVTKLGRFLRATSLDELPQMWNILRGEMSLVGPRPVTDAEVNFYGPNQNIYYALKPGLTGAWQVSVWRGAGFQHRVTLDCNYFQRISLRHDFEIMIATVAAVCRRTGE